ncbi:MAG: glutathione S-transferase family protein, partial [Burkholderiales bacterium]|nr:glutathione S-transferase family protein [Burkholderiales bacterium]
MLKLYGFSVSNYYSKVKLALLEKGVAFEEVLTYPNYGAAPTDSSPLGKIPYLETEHGTLCESQVIADYIEAAYTDHPLMPKDPYAAAKVRELITFMEWHLEIVARELLPAAFFGATASEETKAAVKAKLTKNVAAFARLIKCSPYIAGSEFTLADCAAAVHFPLISAVCNIMFGEDLLAGLPLAQYNELIASRPLVQKVRAGGTIGVGRSDPHRGDAGD